MNFKTIGAIAISSLVLSGAMLRLGAPERAEASAGDAKSQSQQQLAQARVERGKYIVNSTGCGDCHTPLMMGPKGPVPDMTRMLAGHPELMKLPPAPPPSGPWIAAAAATLTAWSGPWGTSFTANLTPDRETGLGAWTEENFVQTIRKGRHLGSGRPLLPPMPFPFYANFSDEDLKSIFAYLQTIPTVKNRVPQPLPPVAAAH